MADSSLETAEVRPPHPLGPLGTAWPLPSHREHRFPAQVDGETYRIGDCVRIAPWPNAPPWVARIDKIFSRTGDSEALFLGARWFYRRRDLLPSGAPKFPPTMDAEREVYLYTGKLHELPSKAIQGRCRVSCGTELGMSELAAIMQDEDAFFYRYEYKPDGSKPGDEPKPLFALPGTDTPAPGAEPPPAAEPPAAAAAAAAKPPAAPVNPFAAAAAAALGGGSADADSAFKVEVPNGAATALVAAPNIRRRPCKTREARLEVLQRKLDAMWPPFVDIYGNQRREMEACIPLEGERYAGESCARCVTCAEPRWAARAGRSRGPPLLCTFPVPSLYLPCSFPEPRWAARPDAHADPQPQPSTPGPNPNLAGPAATDAACCSI